MAGRRRKWFVAAVLLAMLAALVWASFVRHGKMEVQLLFAGYTNYVGSFTNPAPEGPTFTRNVFSALVLATNSGNVDMELDVAPLRNTGSVWPIANPREWNDNVALPIRIGPTRILRPRETILVEFEIQRLGVPWSAELLARRRGLLDRLYVKTMAKGGATARKMAGKWLEPPPEVQPTLRMTNAPLDKASQREWIEPYRPRPR